MAYNIDRMLITNEYFLYSLCNILKSNDSNKISICNKDFNTKIIIREDVFYKDNYRILYFDDSENDWFLMYTKDSKMSIFRFVLSILK